MTVAPTHDAFLPLGGGSGGVPLYRQLYARVRSAVVAGTLAPGDRVPSARALAKELGVARGTIEMAYQLLASEGYLLSRGQAGTVINPALQPPSEPRSTTARLAEGAGASSWDVFSRPARLLPFQMGVSALDEFPRKIWARMGARHLRGMQAADLDYPSPYGLPALRSAIASYLQVARGIDCEAHQVFVTTGHRSSLQLSAQALLEPRDAVWVENPGYPPTRRLLEDMRFSPVAVDVDAQGLMVDEGLARAPDARAAAITPAHQSPLSMSLSLPRRQALLAWAREREAWIFEDDYDGEYRYASRPLSALASSDEHGRVIYLGTFSKVLFPGIRLAYVVAPRDVVPRFERAMQVFLAGAAPALTQAMVAQFMTEGHFSRHIQRMRRLYAERRDATRAALEKGLGGRLKVESQPGGMHLVLRLPGSFTDVPMVQRLLGEHEMAVQALSRWWVDDRSDSGLLLSFTNCTDPELAERLGRLIRGWL